MDAAHPDLVRAWQLYFGQRGGAGPSLPPDVLPTIVLDDNSNGPWPPYRPFFTSNVKGAVAGERGAVGVANVDGYSTTGGAQLIPPIRSAAVIDEIRFRTQTAVSVNIGVTSLNSSPFDGSADKPVSDANPEKDPGGLNIFPRMGNVFGGVRGQVAQMSLDGPPHAELTTVVMLGVWILGPGQVLYVQTNAIADPVTVYFRGRYYGGR